MMSTKFLKFFTFPPSRLPYIAPWLLPPNVNAFFDLPISHNPTPLIGMETCFLTNFHPIIFVDDKKKRRIFISGYQKT